MSGRSSRTWNNAKIDAERRGLLKGIRAMLTVQLPQQAQSLLARLEHVDDMALLDRILQAASAANLEELNRLLP